MDFKRLLEKKYVLLDGAMGTMLQKRGLKIGGLCEELNITNKELIKDVHKLYVEAGSDIIYANTFGANPYKVSKSEYSVEQLIEAAIWNAKESIKETNVNRDVYVALDLGPIGQLLEPTGTLPFDTAYEYYKRQILAGKEADLIVIETQTDLMEVKAAVLAAKENSDKPIIVTMTFEENMRTFTGCAISSMAITLEGLGCDAIGVNCSLGPKELLPVVKEIRKWTSLPIVLKPNAGLPDPETNTYNVTATEFAGMMTEFIKYNVKFFGGCCGTTEEFIKELDNKLKNVNYDEIQYVDVEYKGIPAVCSATNTVLVSEPRVIGERINPTGKKKFKEALLNNDIDYVLSQALEQINANADILDVNVGLPGIDEKEMIINVIKALQEVVDVPLQIDTTIPEVLEAALRLYNGIPIVNSVNGEEKSLSTVLPLVKKYGACVVGLTLDENGIPKTAKERFAIAKKILDRALEYGIPKEKVFIDCLTLTVSAEQDGAIETLKALKQVKEELGLKTVLGVSNISFGLPNREIINHTFLTMALENGLDLPIMNPNIHSMMGAFMGYKVLKAIDENSSNYISYFGDMVLKTSTDKGASSVSTGVDVLSGTNEEKLMHAIEKGLKNEATNYTKDLLNSNVSSMDVVNNVLIPALDKAGSLFEKGKIFLPQLILSATAAQNAFEVIKDSLAAKGDEKIEKGKIVIATVKGDVHDIGKNIVKVLLENYGYTVIDLGKDVDPMKVVEAVNKYNVKLVGLSALMTTTLGSMEETIKLIRENFNDVKVMVGGAVLTPDYAKKIDADFYAKDAKEAVDIAKNIFEK